MTRRTTRRCRLFGHAYKAFPVNLKCGGVFFACKRCGLMK